jgi:hypothetical protein
MTRIVLLTGLLIVLHASLALASPIAIPSGLAPGASYYLAFVTTDTGDALSGDITTYDAFVTAEANSDPTLASLNTTWRVIGSTATVDAVSHIALSGPVYNTQGQLVAGGAADLFDGTLDAPILFTQSGQDLQAAHLLVWSGSDANGVGTPGHQLGSSTVTAGDGDEAGHAWLDGIGGSLLPPALPSDATFHYYAVSAPLVVPTPEPSTIALLLAPFAILLRRRRIARNNDTRQ